MATILILEDHAMSRQMLTALLSYTGHRVIEASDGTAALNLVTEEYPDLIISDVRIPLMDGMEFVRKLRAFSPFKETPVIFYTATCRFPGDLYIDEAYGNCRVIPKPSEPDLILQTIKELLGERAVSMHVGPQAEIHTPNNKKSAFSDATGLQLSILMELSYNMVAQRDPQKLLCTVSRAMGNILNCSHSFLAIQAEGRIRYFCGQTENEGTNSCPIDLLPFAEILENVFVTRVPIRLHKKLKNNGLTSETMLVVPFASPSCVYGWICLIDNLDDRAFSDRDEEIAMTLSTQAALAYDNILMVEQMKKSDEAKSMFIANMSHEFRTPLNILLSSIQLLNAYIQNDEVLDKSKVSKINNMQRQNCNRILRLVNNVIDITKIDCAYFDLKLIKCNIIEVVEAISLSIVEYAGTKSIELVFDTDEEEMELVCDPDSMERIILNLLSNAIKFTPSGGIIYVSLSKTKDYVQICVRDTGIGISKDKLDTIFDRFKQVDSLMTRKSEGSGIGLSLAKLLTEMHGGKIQVCSEYGKGSEFKVEIPTNLIVNNDAVQGRALNSYSENIIQKIQIEFSDIYS
jgi:signal transduction histidine kinase/CheY-like chemotaxis protein